MSGVNNAVIALARTSALLAYLENATDLEGNEKLKEWIASHSNAVDRAHSDLIDQHWGEQVQKAIRELVKIKDGHGKNLQGQE